MDVADFCKEYLGRRPQTVLFEAGYLSKVIGLRLSDGREVVLKIRAHSPRLQACYNVQLKLWEAGFPCPQPLTRPVVSGDEDAISAEILVPGGEQLPDAADSPSLFAGALATLVELAGKPDELSSWEPSPPWAFGHHLLPVLWPPPDDSTADLNAHEGPGWLDDAAVRVHKKLRSYKGPSVIGHADFESQNIRWRDRKLHVVHDWDSLAAMPEPMIAGVASAVFAATGAPHSASTYEQSAEFLKAYQAARHVRWNSYDLEIAWAAGIWVRVFNAKKAYVRDGASDYLDSLAPEIETRLSKADA